MNKSEQMYEKYKQRQDEFVAVNCDSCNALICYTYGDITGALDYWDCTILCKKCKELLP